MIVGNLKMMMTASDVASYLKEMKDISNNNIILCPTNIYVPYFLNQKFKIGLQDIAKDDISTKTGMVCPRQAVSLNIKYTLVGHCDLNEDNATKNKKINEALKYNMTPILCIGEGKKEKNLNKVKKIIFNQLKEILNSTLVSKVIIAYEPVWAIGTNDIPSNKDINDMASYIKETIKKMYNVEVNVLYGGSVHKENIMRIKEVENIDGLLIGEASTNSAEFKEIIKAYFKENNEDHKI